MQFGYANQYPSAYSSAPQQHQPQMMQQQPFVLGMQPTTQMQPALVPLVPLMSYEQSMHMRQELFQQRKEFYRKRIRNDFPTAVALVFAFLIAGVSSLLIAMQIKLITTTNGSVNNGESGLWAGALGLLFVLAVVITGI